MDEKRKSEMQHIELQEEREIFNYLWEMVNSEAYKKRFIELRNSFHLEQLQSEDAEIPENTEITTLNSFVDLKKFLKKREEEKAEQRKNTANLKAKTDYQNIIHDLENNKDNKEFLYALTLWGNSPSPSDQADGTPESSRIPRPAGAVHFWEYLSWPQKVSGRPYTNDPSVENFIKLSTRVSECLNAARNFLFYPSSNRNLLMQRFFIHAGCIVDKANNAQVTCTIYLNDTLYFCVGYQSKTDNAVRIITVYQNKGKLLQAHLRDLQKRPQRINSIGDVRFSHYWNGKAMRTLYPTNE